MAAQTGAAIVPSGALYVANFGAVLPGATYEKTIPFDSTPHQFFVLRDGSRTAAASTDVTRIGANGPNSLKVEIRPSISLFDEVADEYSVVLVNGTEHRLSVRAKVHPATVAVETYWFSETRVGESTTVRMDVRKVKGRAVSVKLSGVSPYFAVDDRDCLLTEKERCDIDVTFAPLTLSAEFAVIAGDLTSGGWPPSYGTPLTFWGTPVAPKAMDEVLVTPGQLNFGDVTVGQSKEMPFTLTNTGSSARTVTSTGVAAPFNMPNREGSVPAKTPVVRRIIFSPTAAGDVSRSFDLTVGDKTLTIPVRGSGIAPPPPPPPSPPAGAVVAVSPTSHSFGTLTFAQSSSKVFTVTNSGGSAATVTSASVTADVTAAMSLSANGCAGQTLAPGVSCTVTVAVGTNVSAGAQTGQLTVATSAGTLTVSLSYTRVM